MIGISLAFAETPQQGLLICGDPGACAADRAWLDEIGGGGPGGFQVLDFGGAFSPGAVPDGLSSLSAFRNGLSAVREAVAARRWAAAIEAADAAEDALIQWKGPVEQKELWELYFLRGVAAMGLGRNQAQAYDFRQAAAIADGVPMPLPQLEPEVARAWLDEQRKMVVSSRGTLELGGGPPATRWSVDGRDVQAGAIPLFPGNHRVTATAPGAIRSWTVTVPVLGGRTSAVQPSFGDGDDPAWVLEQLDGAILRLDAPESVKDLLVAWCTDVGAREARLMRVDSVRHSPIPSRVAMSSPPADRPAAAAGEVLDLGDGVPATFEAEVLARHGALDEEHSTEANRLKVAFFDPQTRRFSTDSTVSLPLRPHPERVRLGLRGAWTGMAGRFHLGGDLVVGVPVRPLELELRLGALRADQDYNFYESWVDPTLWHLQLGARWAPGWKLAPFVALSAELYVPMAVGGRADLGAQLDLGKGWRLEAGGAGGYGTAGLVLGAGLGLSKGI